MKLWGFKMFLTKIKMVEGTDDYHAHQVLWTLFENEQQRPFCFSSVNNVVHMLSTVKPNFKTTEIKLLNNSTLIFKVIACPPKRRFRTRTIKSQDYSASHLKEWFSRVFEDIAKINYVEYTTLKPKSLQKKNGEKMRWSQYLFFGSLTILDAERFENKIARGFGQGAGFGLSMMNLVDITDI